MIDPHYEEITYRIGELQKFLAGFQPTKLPVKPYPSDIRKISDDLELISAKVDAVVEAYGAYFNANTSKKIDLSDFRRQLFGALDGNAMYQVESAAEDLQDDLYASVDDRPSGFQSGTDQGGLK